MPHGKIRGVNVLRLMAQQTPYRWMVNSRQKDDFSISARLVTSAKNNLDAKFTAIMCCNDGQSPINS
jgi:hypothetical protein